MSEEKVVRRGEVWWIDAGISVGSEEKMGRPGVIVSGDSWNQRYNTVNVVYTSSQVVKGDPTRPKIESLGKNSRATCNHVYTVDKSRLDRKVCELTEPEMIRVAGALAVVMQIPQYRHNAKPQPKQEEPADVVALRCERDMWKGMYDKVLEMLVDLRMKETVAQISVVQKTVTEVIEKPPVVEKPKPPVAKREKPPVVKKEESLPVDINHCSVLALRELGLSDADVASVIGCRPFESVLELNCVPDLDTDWVAANEHRFICTPIVSIKTDEATGKVNLNTCEPKDLYKIGITKSLAYKIISDRKRNGPFALVGDVVRVLGIGQKWLDIWIDKLEV